MNKPLMVQDDSQQSTPIFISLIPNLVGGEGHIIPYHQAVSQAIKKLNWHYRVVVPSEPKIENLPLEWHSCLSSYDLETEGNFFGKVLKLNHVIDLGVSIAKYLRTKVIHKSDSSIIFLERFIHLQLLSLIIALLLIPRENLYIWLLYRRDVHKDKTKFIYKLLNNLIAKILKPGRLKLLTDSELLSQSLSEYFQESVTVMPIPHTYITCEEIDSKKESEITCWWAGSPRLEKGWGSVKSLVNISFKASKNICLVASKSSELQPIKQGIEVQNIDNNLTRNEYDYWLCHSDFILLPYISEAYRERTSGVFTECIIAGKIPLVTSQTWMANELTKYQLDELILDWDNPQLVLEKIVEISHNSNIKDKIKRMQADYFQFHNMDSYAEKIREIFYDLSVG